MYELIVVGGGPAGLSAVVYVARKRLNSLLISLDIGGQPNYTNGIENYLGYQFIEGPELMAKFYAQVKQFPVEQKVGYRVTRIDGANGGFQVITETGDKYESKAVIFATGKKPRKLGVPGEDKFRGRGVSYCSICDGPIFSGQRVAIMGGGNSAVSAALDMAKIAEHVSLISNTPLTADPHLTEKLGSAKNLSLLVMHQTVKIEGNEFVKEVVIKDMAEDKEKRLGVAGVFVEIGLVPNSEPVKHLVKLNKSGEVPISCYCETTRPGLFAAGDVTDVPEKQIIIAAGEGAKAALQAHHYLQELSSLS